MHFFRHGTDTARQITEAFQFHFIGVAVVPVVIQVRFPGKRSFTDFTPLFHHTVTAIHRITVHIDHFSHITGSNHTFGNQFIAVDFARCRVLFDFLVHHRLGCTRLIRLVMAVTAVADQVDHHIAVKGVTEIQCQAGHKGHRFRIIGIHVENRRLYHLHDVSTVFR